MAHTVVRHTSNYVVLLALLFAAAIGLDWLLIQWERPPLFGCLLRPILYLVLSKTVAIGVMSAGAVILLFDRTRPTGKALLLAGILIGVLPELVEGYLRPLCSRHATGIDPPAKPLLAPAPR